MLFISFKSSFGSQVIKILPWCFGYVEKRFDWIEKVNFKVYDATT